MTTVYSPAMANLDRILRRHGMMLRGAFLFSTSDTPPSGPTGAPARAVLLIGHGGGGIWPHFVAWRALFAKPVDHPLDTWSRGVIDPVAAAEGARAVYPSDKPYMPFQQWAMRAERLRPSPLGVLMHPEFGPWHAYRGALIFGEGEVAEEVRALNQPAADPIHLCDLCVGKPCQKACPASAHAGEGFQYQNCLTHVHSPAGAACRDTGCLDRNACPHGAGWRYPADMQAFIMKAFAGL